MSGGILQRANITDHRDAGLLEMLARLTALRDQVELARRGGGTAYCG